MSVSEEKRENGLSACVGVKVLTLGDVTVHGVDDDSDLWGGHFVV
jgi:hypothetical protein